MRQVDAHHFLIVIVDDHLQNGAGQQVIRGEASFHLEIQRALSASAHTFSATVALVRVNSDEVTAGCIFVPVVRLQLSRLRKFLLVHRVRRKQCGSYRSS
jgi:hypothetical protein